MRAFNRASAAALALVVMSCSGTPTEDFPDSPGVAISGLTRCATAAPCASWSPNGVTLYKVANLLPPDGVSLQSLDPTTHTVTRIGSIDTLATAPVFSPDGTVIYYAAPTDVAQTQFNIRSMVLATGAKTTIGVTGSSDLLVSPDGTALAYHALGGTAAADTIVLQNIPAGTRRATTVVTSSVLRAFSSDGARLAVTSASTIQIWHVVTGARDTIPSPAGVLQDLKFSRGDFRALLIADVGTLPYTEVPLSGGATTTYTLSQFPHAVVWLPDRTAIVAARPTLVCGDQDCNFFDFEFQYVTASTTISLGSMKGPGLYLFSASPDGRWVVHSEGATAYLLSNAQP